MEGLEVSHFQYAEDNVLVDVLLIENLLTIKAVRRSFKLVSRVKVIFCIERWIPFLLNI